VLSTLAYLGWRAEPIALLGGDRAAAAIVEDLKDSGVATAGIERQPGAETTRIVQKLIRTREFRERSWNDKRVYFEALGKCAPPAMLPTVQALYEKRGWFEKPKDLEMRAGAAILLGLIGGEQVVDLLEQGCQAEEAVMREACRQALDGIRRLTDSARPEEPPAPAPVDEEETA